MGLLDLSNINKITNGNERSIAEFLRVFSENTTSDLIKLKGAMDAEDARQIHYFVHKLKSSVQSIGYLNGHKQLARIEEKLHLGHSIPPLRMELTKVTRECEMAVVEARKLLEKYVK